MSNTTGVTSGAGIARSLPPAFRFTASDYLFGNLKLLLCTNMIMIEQQHCLSKQKKIPPCRPQFRNRLTHKDTTAYLPDLEQTP